MGAAVEVRNFTKRFGKVSAVDNVSLVVAPGQILGLVGPNGAGKTTLLECLAGILRTDAGTAFIAGHDVAADPVPARRALAFVPETPSPYPMLTPYEHLLFIARVFEMRDGWQPNADQILTALDLDQKRDSLATTLSKGQRQKIHLAMAMLRDPSVLLLDEPLIGIDPKGGRILKQWIRARAAAGGAGIVSSHSLPLVEEVCDRVAIMNGGRVVAEGTLEELRQLVSGARQSSLEDVFLAITEGVPFASGR